ncbi:hypothetical protein YC2023_081760 [Brassica napus]
MDECVTCLFDLAKANLGESLQHRVLAHVDLLVSEYQDAPRSIAAKRVHNSTEVDVIFVPLFLSLSYHRFSKVNPHHKISRNRDLKRMLLTFLTAQEEWKRSGGRDHSSELSLRHFFLSRYIVLRLFRQILQTDINSMKIEKRSRRIFRSLPKEKKKELETRTSS